MILQRRSFGWLVAVLVLAGAALRAVPAAAPSPSHSLDFHGALPVVAEHKYRMLGKVRPLLFWIGKDDVGGAAIRWRGDQTGGSGLELLIGSDPAKAPRKINRWGYIFEQLRGSEAQVLGVMKESNERTIEEAESKVSERASGEHTFRAIQGVSTAQQSKASVTTVRVRRDLTFREVGELVGVVTGGRPNGPARTVTLPPGTKPGFLFAVRDLVEQSAAFYADSAQRGRTLQLRPVQYVYYGSLYDLSIRSARLLPSASIDKQAYSNLVRAEFEITNRTTEAKTQFQLTYGTAGPLAGIPVHIVYRPRWWFEVQLFLDERVNF